tara:strand:- start:424 stop:1683 length:1260 start_codon:yes stop_codon:yes gene_type:complete
MTTKVPVELSSTPSIVDNGDATAITIDSSERVGIGTTSPSTLLHLSNASNPAIRITDTTNTLNIEITATDTVGYFGTESNHATAFITNNTERMRIDSSGNVGIGTNNPSTMLSVLAADGVADNNYLVSMTNSESTAGRNYGVAIQAGTNGSDISFQVNNYNASSNLMRIKGNGDCHFPNASSFGIGTDSAATTLHAKASGDCELRLEAGANQDARVRFGDATDNDLGYIGFNRNSGYMNFSINNTQGEHMRIDSSGKILMNTTTQSDSTVLTLGGVASSKNGLAIVNSADTGTIYSIYFRNSSGSLIGSITNSGSGVAFNASSDYRLKENIKPLENGLSRVQQLKPIKFDWIDSKESCEGFIAHEVDEIFTDAVAGIKDAEEMQGIDYGRITPLLVKAIQEQQELIESLTARIDQMENK